MDEFLKTEYEQCFSLIKYYDERHQSLVKYCAGLSSAVPTLLLAIYQLGPDIVVHFWKFTAVISAITAIGLFSIFTVLIQTRLYFIYPVRQVNAIREFELSSTASFENNQMYLDTSFSAFKWSSSHTLLNAFVVLQIGAFISLSIFSLNFGAVEEYCLVSKAISVGIILSSITFIFSALYLQRKSKHHPDISIHGKKR
ncbi:MAG: hypothetical protein KUF74_03545 [Candidatus Thiodiazotropha sp. (ex Ctena orbiculata)]|nr:hypothetical protein [Candidatus Thiodiazotropha taylori]